MVMYVNFKIFACLCLHKTLHYVTMVDRIYHSIAKQLENDTILKMIICICR